MFDGGDSAGVELAWNAPAVDAESVTGYEILRAQGDGDLVTLVADTGSADTTYTDDTATKAGESYAYRVKALRGEEASRPSDRAVAIIPKATAVPVEPGIAEEQQNVGAPTELNAAADGRTAIDLSWTAPPAVEGVTITGYRIEVSTDDDPTWTDAVTNTNSTDTSYRYTDVLLGTTYHFRVSAIDSGGPGTASDVASVSIEPGPRSFLFHIEEARMPTIDRTGRQFEMWFIFQNLTKPVFLSENILDAIQVEHGMASNVRCLVEAFVSCASSPNSGHNYYVFTVTADESQYSGSEGTLTRVVARQRDRRGEPSCTA